MIAFIGVRIVAHVGQELRLHARGLLGLVAGALDGLGGLPLVGTSSISHTTPPAGSRGRRRCR